MPLVVNKLSHTLPTVVVVMVVVVVVVTTSDDVFCAGHFTYYSSACVASVCHFPNMYMFLPRVSSKGNCSSYLYLKLCNKINLGISYCIIYFSCIKETANAIYYY